MESDATPVLPYLSTVSFDRLLPLSELVPADFVQFACDFLAAYDLNANVHLKEMPDCKQDFAEIGAQFPDEKLCTYLCRQAEQFEPAEVQEAIEAYRTKAGQKHILLSCEVNSDVRNEMRKFGDWELWDQVDITQRFRELPEFEQVRLVDIYFPGQRFDLTMLTCAGPWRTVKDYFAPMLDESKALNHCWDLVGRDSEVSQLLQALANPDVRVVSIVGPAGSSKTRVLRSVLESFVKSHRHVRIGIASHDDEIWASSMDGIGTGENLLVIDDLHDRRDRDQVFRSLGSEQTKARLLLVYRSYCEEIIQIEMAREGLFGESVASVALETFAENDAKLLAQQVLVKHGGEADLADRIAGMACDSPLAVVLGAQIIAKEGANSEVFQSAESFRSAIFLHYRQMIIDDIAAGEDKTLISKILCVYALIQPFDLHDPGVSEMLANLEGIDPAEAWRFSKNFINARILFIRGAMNQLYRLSSDLLADSLIHSGCMASNGESNGYAERIFDLAGPEHKEHILLNLSRFGWRQKGVSAETRLVDTVWSRLGKGDLWYIQASAAVVPAFYQPRQALDFARRLVEQGHGIDESVCRIIRNAAYRFECQREACELLWEIAKNDYRPVVRRRSNQPIYLLELFPVVTPAEPLKINEAAVDFALSLFEREDSWTGAATPFDILKGGLDADSAVPRVFSYTDKSVWYGTSMEIHAAIAPMRRRIIHAIFESLISSRKRQALAAAALLEHALCLPRWLDMPAGKDAWLNEFVDTLTRLNALIDANPLPAAVLVRLGQSVSWHAHDAYGPTHAPARQIIAQLERDLETRATSALMDHDVGYVHSEPTIPCDVPAEPGFFHSLSAYAIHIRRRPDFMIKILSSLMNDSTPPENPNEIESTIFEHFCLWKPQIEKIAEDIELAFPNPVEIIGFLNECLTNIKSYVDTVPPSAKLLIRRLFERQPALARQLLDIVQQDTSLPLTDYASYALSSLLKHAPDETRKYLVAFFEKGEAYLPLIAGFYANIPRKEMNCNDDGIIACIFQSSYASLLEYAPRIIEMVAETDPRIAITLIAHANPELIKSAKLGFFDRMSDDDLTSFCDSLNDEASKHVIRWLCVLDELDNLDNYAIDRFLSVAARQKPLLLLNLAKVRLERALAEEKENANYHIFRLAAPNYDRNFYNLFEHPDGEKLLYDTLDWAVPRISDTLFSYQYAKLVAGLFQFTESAFASVLDAWITEGNTDKFAVIAAVLSKAPSHFIFVEENFVERLLRAARSAGMSVRKALSEALYASAVGGLRIGYGGLPSPDDMKDSTKERLAALNRIFSEK